MASTEISIKQLPTISSIETGNSLIVQTDNATNKLDFKDFVIGLENTTFANTINTLTTRVNAIYAAPSTTSDLAATHYVNIVSSDNNTYKLLLTTN